MISVCIASFNGESFIQEQLNSILQQITHDDEVIIVDDCSSDKTCEIITDFADERIHLYRNKNNIGPIKSFQSAILKSRGKYIFLSDQDDVWNSDKVSRVISQFQKTNADLIVHDGIVVDSNKREISPSWNQYNRNILSTRVVDILFKNGFTGANMAFDHRIVSLITPFPDHVLMHDWWIALVCAKLHKKIVFMDEKLILYRRHGNNVTGKKNSVIKMFMNRIQMLLLLIQLSRSNT